MVENLTLDQLVLKLKPLGFYKGFSGRYYFIDARITHREMDVTDLLKDIIGSKMIKKRVNNNGNETPLVDLQGRFYYLHYIRGDLHNPQKVFVCGKCLSNVCKCKVVNKYIAAPNPQKRKKAEKRLSNKRWTELRLFLLESKHHSCEDCGKEAKYVHHLNPVSIHPEMQFEVSNLRVLCMKCHRSKHPELPDCLFID